VATIVDLVAADLAVDVEADAEADVEAGVEAGAVVFLVTLFLAGVAEEAVAEAVVLSDVFVILYDV